MVKELLRLMRIQEGTLIEVHMNATREAEGDAEHFVGWDLGMANLVINYLPQIVNQPESSELYRLADVLFWAGNTDAEVGLSAERSRLGFEPRSLVVF